MEIKIELCASENRAALQRVLLTYSREYDDQRSAELIEAVLNEAAYAAGWRFDQKGCAGFIMVRALAAAELQSNLALWQQGAQKNQELPQTRRKLWLATIEGILVSFDDAAYLPRLAQAFFEPMRLSPNEENELRDCMRERFDKLSSKGAEKLHKISKSRPVKNNAVALRGVLQAVVRHSSENLLQEIVPAGN
jgi:hypothetical protein